MKQALFGFLISLLLVTPEIHAQDLECGTTTSGYGSPLATEKDMQEGLPDNPYTQVDIALAMHIIRSGSGSGGFNPASLPQLVTNLNSHFALVGIRFFITRIDFIDNQTYYDDYDWTNEEEDDLSVQNRISDAVNIYFLPSCQYKGKATLPPPIYLGRDIQSIILKNAYVLTSTSPHEMGHYFNLLHTFDDGIYGSDCPDYSTCSTLGDRVCDTPAEPDDPGDHPSNFNSSCQ